MQFTFDFFTFTKEITKRCDEFEQGNSGWLMLYVFNCKGESVWNERQVFFHNVDFWLVSLGMVAMWSKIVFKKKVTKIAVLKLCEINDNTLGFCLVLSRHIHNLVEQIRWNVLQK